MAAFPRPFRVIGTIGNDVGGAVCTLSGAGYQAKAWIDYINLYKGKAKDSWDICKTCGICEVLLHVL